MIEAQPCCGHNTALRVTAQLHTGQSTTHKASRLAASKAPEGRSEQEPGVGKLGAGSLQKKNQFKRREGAPTWPKSIDFGVNFTLRPDFSKCIWF